MEEEWKTLADEIHQQLCKKYDSDEVSAGGFKPGFVPKDRLDFFKLKFQELMYIIRTQGLREGIYVTYNYAKRKYFPPKPADYSGIVPKGTDPLKWEKKTLTFPRCEEPEVSIIIPVYNKWGYTYNCLKSILSSDTRCTYEIIIADDCSTDETAELEKYVVNVTHVRNETNLNFLRNCNNAAGYARGKYILFLNNDTLVMKDWLQSLYDLIESDATIGMVGSKFIYPDGTLQEAGGMLFSDGTGKNYGRGDNPGKAPYNYVKDVDYISGASIMLPRALWNELGSFDERFAPAYYEDSDLAFKIREAGYRVVYQPKSELVHFERTSMSENGLVLNETNKAKFMEKWASELLRDSGPEYRQRDRSKFKKSILYVDDKVPMFDQHAGGKTTYNFLQLLCDLGFKVTFVGIFDYTPYQPYTGLLQQMGIEVLYGQEYASNLQAWLNQNAKYYDIVFLNRPECAIVYLDWFINNTDCTIAYYGHDLHWLRERREYELTGDEKLLERSNKSKETEMYIMSKSDIVMSVSPEEKTIIDEELGEKKTFVTPIFFYREQERKPFSTLDKHGLLFVGGYNHTPNIDAVEWFMNDVLPIIRKTIPDIDVTLAGSHPTKWIQSLESEHVHVPGYMSDENLDELYDRSLISIAPLRFGAGVKGKVVDAMHHGMPVVSTSIGTEGLPGIESCITAHDDAESFAKAVIELYQNPVLVEEAYEKNYRYVLDTFGYNAALDTFRNIFGESSKTETKSDDGLKILDLSYSIDCPATAGGSLRIVSPLTKINPRSDISVDLIFTTWSYEYAEKMETCLRKIPVIRNAKGIVVKNYLSDSGGKPDGLPSDVWETMSKEFSDYIDTLVRQNHYDIIQIEHTQFAWLVPRLRLATPSSKIVLDAHNIEYRVYESWIQYAGKDRHSIEERYNSLRAWEEKCIPWFDAAFTVSPIEEDLLKRNGCERTYLVPTGGGIDPDKYAPTDENREKPYDVLYIGSMNWFANSHGLMWFIRDVLPIVEEKRPGTNLNIVGNGTPPKELWDTCKRLPNVKFWGFQEDDVGFLHQSKLFIVPLFIGAGARVKVITAWASKTPVVSTAFGAEGLDAKDGENILFGDTPEAFADAIVRLLDDESLRKRISDSAFATLESKYTVQQCADELVDAYREISGR